MAHQNAAFSIFTQGTNDVGYPDPNAYSQQLTRAVTSTLILFLCGVGIVLLTVMALSCYRLCLFLRMGQDREAFATDNFGITRHCDDVPPIYVISNMGGRDPRAPWNAPPPAYDEILPPPYSSVAKVHKPPPPPAPPLPQQV